MILHINYEVIQLYCISIENLYHLQIFILCSFKNVFALKVLFYFICCFYAPPNLKLEYVLCVDNWLSVEKTVIHSAQLNLSAMWHIVHRWTTQQCDLQCIVEPLSNVTYIAHLNHSRMWHTVHGSTTKLCDKQCAVEPLSSVKYSALLSHSAMWHTVCSWTTQQLCSMVARDVISEGKNNNPLTLYQSTDIQNTFMKLN